ncbi:MAG: hypothetical protein ABSG53_02515 [Thermoguttaceae bacterium]|jgi:hypothetical protein
MPNSCRQSDEVQIGDRVAYRLTTGETAPGVLGKVIGMFNTRDGQTLADVEWDKLGPPKRLSITNLTRV